MIAIAGYQITTKLYESSKSLVYRGCRLSDKFPVILKVLKQEYPPPEEIARFKLEYEITRHLTVQGTVRAYSLDQYQHSLVMTVEDFGGESLNLNPQQFTLETVIKLAIQITEILGEIHQQHIIHKDINPSNIVFNPVTGQLKIIDFGISTILARENPILTSPHILEGTLAKCLCWYCQLCCPHSKKRSSGRCYSRQSICLRCLYSTSTTQIYSLHADGKSGKIVWCALFGE